MDSVQVFSGGQSASKGIDAQGRVANVDDELFDHAASHLGKAVGISNLLRGTAYHAARCRQMSLTCSDISHLMGTNCKHCILMGCIVG